MSRSDTAGLFCSAVAWAEHGRSDQPRRVPPHGQVGLRLVGLDGSSEKALAYEPLRARVRDRAAREEERIMYVAATRARERLIVSAPADAKLRTQTSGVGDGGDTAAA